MNARSKSADKRAKETGRVKFPAHCESKRIVACFSTLADYARVMWTSIASVSLPCGKAVCFGGNLIPTCALGFRQVFQDG